MTYVRIGSAAMTISSVTRRAPKYTMAVCRLVIGQQKRATEKRAVIEKAEGVRSWADINRKELRFQPPVEDDISAEIRHEQCDSGFEYNDPAGGWKSRPCILLVEVAWRKAQAIRALFECTKRMGVRITATKNGEKQCICGVITRSA